MTPNSYPIFTILYGDVPTFSSTIQSNRNILSILLFANLSKIISNILLKLLHCHLFLPLCFSYYFLILLKSKNVEVFPPVITVGTVPSHFSIHIFSRIAGVRACCLNSLAFFSASAATISFLA